jgi:hypothetical protein
MAYIIRKTNGTTLGTILDGTVDTAQTSLTLVGRNYSNYGQIMTDNLVKLTENFAYNISPPNPLGGQLWWDTATSLLKVYTGSSFKVISSATAQNSTILGAPVTVVAGDIWWDTAADQLYVYNGATPYNIVGWQLVGPTWNKAYGKSGTIWEQIVDTVSTTHSVVSIYLNGVRTAIISESPEFTPSGVINGFSTIKTGYNIYSDRTVWGTANNANYLGGTISTNYLRADINNSSTGRLSIVNNSGLLIGLSGNLQIATTTASDVIIRNTKTNGDINFYANVAGIDTLALSIDGATGATGLISASLSGSLLLGAGATVTGALNVIGTGSYSGSLTALTQPAGTINTTVATTAFVINNSGFLTNKIYASNSYLEILDTGTGSANLAIDGVSVMTASAAGVTLKNGALATTQAQTYLTTGNAAVATTEYVSTAKQWWGGSAKFVSIDAPNPGVNDIGSHDGDFWFQRSL